jgi:hypothetical protein
MFPAPADTIDRDLDERFIDVICADEELLAAEFDAIIAANWPAPPTDAALQNRANRTRPRPNPHPANPIVNSAAPSGNKDTGRARQRSPPRTACRTS